MVGQWLGRQVGRQGHGLVPDQGTASNAAKLLQLRTVM